MKKIVYLLLLAASICTVGCSATTNAKQVLPLPGSSNANIKLQADTLPQVYVVVGAKSSKSCKVTNMTISDTKVTKAPYGLKFKNERAIAGQWEEVWTVKACSKTFDVPIKFALDETGASYMIPTNEVVEK